MKYFIPALIVMLTMTGCFERTKVKAQLIKTLYENRINTSTVDDPSPALGTLLSWGCDGYTRLNEIADGQGGSTTERIERSADCDWDPPEAGTVSVVYCADDENFTQVTKYNDGEYGFYEETVERSAECGYLPPFVVEVKGTGDRFDPAIFEIESSIMGDEIDVAVTLGTVEQVDDELRIRGNGRIGDGILTVNGNEWQYSIVAEPRCGTQRITIGFVDCQGLRYQGRADGMIYYGEEDTRVVTWEISVFYYSGNPLLWGKVDQESPYWERAQKQVDYYNIVYARSDVYIEFKLASVGLANFDVYNIAGTSPVFDNSKADIMIGMGNTCPDTCGCAQVNTYFQEDSFRPLGSVSLCGGLVDVHEIGHSVGLAHGPDNRGFPADGYIFRDFGHGHSTPFCGRWTDIMSYESGPVVANNSRQTCRDYAEDEYLSLNVTSDEYDNPAGSREYADSAYHLNRIRYDVSLIHCRTENMCIDAPARAPMSDEDGPVSGSEDNRILIEDRVNDFENGPEMVERARREQEQFLRNNPQFRNK